MTTPLGVEIDAVTHRFRGAEALSGRTVSIRPGTITGLIGRNGAGKTTLLSLVAALRPVQTGSVRVGDRAVWEDPSVTSRICLVRDRAASSRTCVSGIPCACSGPCARAGTRSMPLTCSAASGCR